MQLLRDNMLKQDQYKPGSVIVIVHIRVIYVCLGSNNWLRLVLSKEYQGQVTAYNPEKCFVNREYFNNVLSFASDEDYAISCNRETSLL